MRILYPLEILTALLISLYQKIFSPDHSFWGKLVYPYGYCRYHPSCSEYTKKAIRKYGFFKGAFKGVKRILKCNPWADGGIDLP